MPDDITLSHGAPTNGVKAGPSPPGGADTVDQPTDGKIDPAERVERGLFPKIPGYEITSELGRGGMGVIYMARQNGLDRLVALKMVLSGAHANTDQLLRFLAEAETAAHIRHQGIVQVYETGRHEGLPFFTMELVDGGSLADRLDAGPLPSPAAARVALLLAEAVAAAHTAGVVHRDLKPSNIMLTAHGIPKITDFGLAKRFEAGDGLTRTGSILGTPSYMPPEQARGDKAVGPAGDVYALGAILYEMLTGRPPFRSDNPISTLSLVLNSTPARPRSLNPAVPGDLETVALKCLEKEPAKRYATADALATDLRRFLDGRAILARRAGAAEKLGRWAKRNPAVAALLGGVFLSLASGVMVSTAFAIRAARNAERADGNAAELAQKVTEVKLAQKETEAKAADAEIARDAAQAAETESRRRLARQNILIGIRNLDTGDPAVALLWFNRAWVSDPDPGNATSHRTRIASLLGQQPDLLGACFHPTKVCDAVFSPDGTRVLARNDADEAFVWDYANSRLAVPPNRHAVRVRHVCYIPECEMVATASADGTAVLWAARTGELLHTLKHAGPLTWVEFHPKGGTVLTAADDKTLRLWDAKTGRQLDWAFPTDGVIEHAAFSPDGTRILVTKTSGTARVWSVDPPAPLSPEFPQHVSSDDQRYNFNYDSWPRFSPDGQAVVTFKEKKLRVWTGRGDPNVIDVPVFALEAYFIGASNRVFVTGASHLSVVVGLAEKKVLFTSTHPRNANIGGVSPNGRYLLTSSSGGLVHLWDGSTGQPLWSPQRCGDFASAVAFSRDSKKCLAAGQDGTIRVWACTRVSIYPGYEFDDGRANAVLSAFPDGHTENRSPDGRARVSIGGPKPAALQPEGAKVPVPLVFSEEFTAAQFCNDGSRVILSGPKAIAAVDSSTGVLASPPVAAGAGGKPFHLKRASRDGSRVALWDDPKTLSVWDLTSGRRVFGPTRNDNPGKRIFEPETTDGHVRDLALSADGRRLAAFTNSSGTLTVYDVDSGRRLHHAKWFRGEAWGFGFSSEGQRIFAWVSDGTVRVFDTETGRPVGPVIRTNVTQASGGSTTKLFHCDIAPDGRKIVAFDAALPGVRMWDVAGGDVLMSVPTPSVAVPTHLWFAADGSRFTLIADGKWTTAPVPRFDVPTARVEPLVRFLTGQRIDEADGLEFVEQTEYIRDPTEYRRAFLVWKNLSDDPAAQPPTPKR